MERAFKETAAISNFISFLEFHATKIHTLDLSQNILGKCCPLSEFTNLADENAMNCISYFLGHTGCQLKRLYCVNSGLKDIDVMPLAEVDP
jgi:hypothetical protein